MVASVKEISLKYGVNNHLKYAVYLPAVQPQYACGVVQENYTQSLPSGLAISDFNYLKPGSKLFNLQAVLYSAGNIKNHRNPPPCMISTRQRGLEQNTIVVGDSGGYQIATGQLKVTPTKREEIYDWLVETCDVSMTLDVPVWALDKSGIVGCTTFEDCLYATLDNLSVFESLGAENHRFLNVLQGRTIEECDEWYDAVKHFNFYGWAMSVNASQQPNCVPRSQVPFSAVLWRIIAMLSDGMFDRDQVWIHFLGVGSLKTALLLTTLKETLSRLLPYCAVEITYDTSSPSHAARVLSGVGSFEISQTKLGHNMVKVDKDLWADNPDSLPFLSSTVGKHLTRGDVIKQTLRGKPIVRELGSLILENNNVEATVGAIDAAHQLLNSSLSREQLNQLFPYHLLDAQDAIERVLTQSTLPKAREVLMNSATQTHLDNAYKNVKRINR